jgi:Tfp pilus assembly protein PilF
LYFVLKRMTQSAWQSACVAVLFAIHPLNVQSVAWIAERKNVLSTFFWILTMGAYFRYVKAPSMRRYLAVVIAFTLGMLSKSMLVTLPFVLLLLDYWPLGRLRVDGENLKSIFKPMQRLIVEKLPLFAITLAGSLVTLWAQRDAGAVADLEVMPLQNRLMNVAVAYVSYIGKTFWPSNLAFHYPHPLLPYSVARVALCVVLLVAITGVALKLWKTRPYVIVGWLWFLGTLVPVIGIVQVGSQAMADRFAYVPTIGLFIAVVWSVPWFGKEPAKALRVPLAAVACVILALLSVRAWIEVSYWKDDLTLFGRALVTTKDNGLAHNNYGGALRRANRKDEAIKHFQEALRINPSHVGAIVNLSMELARQGKVMEAAQGYRAALAIQPNHVGASLNLAILLLDARMNKPDEALGLFQKVAETNPTEAKAFNGIGAIMASKGRKEEAMKAFQTALRLDPSSTSAMANLERLRKMP